MARPLLAPMGHHGVVGAQDAARQPEAGCCNVSRAHEAAGREDSTPPETRDGCKEVSRRPTRRHAALLIAGCELLYAEVIEKSNSLPAATANLKGGGDEDGQLARRAPAGLGRLSRPGLLGSDRSR